MIASADPRVRGWAIACLVTAAAGVLLLVVSARRDAASWLPSYLFAWLFVLGLSLGSLAWAALLELTGGAWGLGIRPFVPAALQLLPLTVLLALPLLLAPGQLWPWMQAGAGAAGQSWYLNAPFFYVRALVYFAIWLGLARLLRDDRGAARGARHRGVPMQAVAAAALALYALTTTFAAIDWTMSLTPAWRSTAFGLLIGTGQVLSALAGAIACTCALARTADAALRQRLHDLGNLALALVLVWAYIAFMQFLIIWIEDLPDEIPWFLVRSRTSWSALSIFVVIAHFVLPFLLALSRAAKRSPPVLGCIAALILLACLADSFWLVVPAFRPGGFELRWSDLAAVMAVGGVWLAGLFLAFARPAGVPGRSGVDHGAQHA